MKHVWWPVLSMVFHSWNLICDVSFWEYALWSVEIFHFGEHLFSSSWFMTLGEGDFLQLLYRFVIEQWVWLDETQLVSTSRASPVTGTSSVWVQLSRLLPEDGNRPVS
jgi:hypothetical protein